MLPLQDRISRVAVDWAPVSRVCRVRKLGGGVLTSMHAFDLVTKSEVQRVVLRRYRSGPQWQEVMAGMLRTLAILEAEGIPAPRALWSDPVGLAFGVPAVVLTRIRGGSIGRPSHPSRWAQQLGAVLARIHALPINEYDVSYLPPPLEVAPTLLQRAFTPRRDVAAHPLAEVVLAGLRRLSETLELKRPVFVHGDFWPGQAIWWRGQLQGIVDWDFPRLDDPGVDIGYCRMDIAIMTNPAVAAEFLEAYEAVTGESFRNLRFWDLLAAYQAMEHPGRWHRQGFSGIGRRDLRGATLERKLADFVGAA